MEVFIAEDLIAEILVRLPARSIGRFRCVCRRWRSLTSDPKFVVAHASRAPISGLFIPNGDHFALDHRLRSLPSHPHPPGCSNFNVVSSCNGLVLLNQRPIKGPSSSYLLYNPVTAQSWPAISQPDNIHLFSVVLAFDPARSPDFKIFGFASSSRILVYSSRTRRWRLVDGHVYHVLLPSKQVYWNSHVLWDSWDHCLVSFDVEAERFGRVELPPTNGCFQYLGLSGGSLHYIGSPESLRFRIWELMPDLSGWSPLRSVSVLDVVPGLHGPHGAYWMVDVVYFHRGSGGQDDQLFLRVSGNVYSYHLQAKTFTTLHANLRQKVFPHAETLISPLLSPLPFDFTTDTITMDA